MDHDMNDFLKKNAIVDDYITILDRKPIVVEFVGPTGGGKTTNCNYFKELLTKNGYKVVEFKDLKNYLNSQKFYFRFYITFKIVFLRWLELLKFKIVLLKNGIYSFDSLLRYFKLCVFNEALNYFIKNRRFDIILLDQWIIQGLWSTIIFKANSYSNLIKNLEKFYFKSSIVIYFDIDEETASRRVGSRSTSKSRFDLMNHEERLIKFKKYNQYLFQMYENSKCANKFKLSSKESPLKNAHFFLNKLTNNFNK